MVRLFFVLSFCSSLLFACRQQSGTAEAPQDKKTAPLNQAQRIIQKSIEVHGGEKYENSTVQFEFRDRTYRSKRQNGRFVYERITVDSSGVSTRDVLTNDTFYREIDGQRQPLTSKDSAAYSNSVNSVLYFALLPYFLLDPAAQAAYLGEESIKGKPYFKIKVSFRQQGGGKDFEDEFIYWIHQDRYTMDYLAYNYLTDGGGARFRQAYNVRYVNGLRFTDYINFRPPADNRNVATFGQLFEKGQLVELSRIELENITVK